MAALKEGIKIAINHRGIDGDFNALKEGIKIAINTAMIAITTKSSINVKAFVFIVTSPY
ncbi:MAG: hypothetical protein ACYS3N_16565 [Planctomycetota bacterium]